MATTSLKLEKTKTPGIYSRGGRYVVVFRDPAGKQKKRFVSTMAEAKRVKAALSTDVSRGEYREPSRMTFAEYAAEWIVSYGGRTRKGVREETRRDYGKRLEQDAIPFLGQLRLSEIEARDLDALAAKIASRGVKPNTVRLSLAPVKALLATAHQRGDLRSNPAAGYRTRYEQPTVDQLESDVEQVKALMEAELQALLGTVAEPWRLFFEFLAVTGMRIGEAIELRWGDVDFGARTVRIERRFYRGKVAPPKSRFGRRTLRLPASLAQALWVQRGKNGDDELVFHRGAGWPRRPVEPEMSRILKPAAVEAGLGEWIQRRGETVPESWVGFHTFRHTCATMLFRSGWNAVQVQRWLGHHKPSFTLDTYVHLLEDDLPEPFEIGVLSETNGTEEVLRRAASLGA
jgi:integrase